MGWLNCRACGCLKNASMKTPVALFLLLLLLAIPSRAADAPLDLGSIVERHVRIPMRDGAHLSAYLYTPPGEGPWPAIFEQRYADVRSAGSRRAMAALAESGFVAAVVNFRGAQESEGEWVGYRALGWGALKDGYDICEWLAAQPWSTGKVGSFGGSQGGYAQNFLAVTRPPHLVAQYMTDTGLSLFQEGYRIGGITRPERYKDMAKVCRVPAQGLALIEEWFRHPDYDDYWRAEDCSLHFAEMNVPCFTVGSWYDFMCQGSVQSFIGRQHCGGPESRGRQQLVLGPWLHGGVKSNKIGQLVFPENAAWSKEEHLKRWFAHWLKGDSNGVEAEPAVRYYTMGAVGEKNAPGNVWRTAEDWPPRAEAASYFLREGGALTTAAPAGKEAPTTFTSDPRHPMSIPGRSFPGAQDARAFEQQPDVRTFTTEPLAAPIEWTGLVKAELFIASTARDTDLLVRISDVYPDGRSMLLMDYPRRARYRDGFERQELLTPGVPARLAFDVGWTSIIFAKGRRIRVTIASTGAPLYEPNPQTGEAQTIEFPADAVVATSSILHGKENASRIVAPVHVVK